MLCRNIEVEVWVKRLLLISQSRLPCVMDQAIVACLVAAADARIVLDRAASYLWLHLYKSYLELLSHVGG